MAKTITENLIKIYAGCVLGITIFLVVLASFDRPRGEAEIGDFSAATFNEGWELNSNEEKRIITLPCKIDAPKGAEVTLKNTLPNEIHDGMALTFRSTMSDAKVYIDGNLRSEYTSEKLGLGIYHLPSAYIITNLTSDDAGKTIEIYYKFKLDPTINDVKISDGNNAWFGIIQKSFALNFVALMTLILGTMMIITVFIMQRSFAINGTIVTLGLLMVDLSLYVISESTMRQLIFTRPSLSAYFTYFAIESLSIFACMYLDEVQHKRYHNRYLAIEGLACATLFINSALQGLGLVEFYPTLFVSHIWMLVGVIMAIINVITDVRNGKIKEYKITSVGVVIFVSMGFFELAGFYMDRNRVLGVSLCGGLVVLMVATTVQLVTDERMLHAEREKRQTSVLVSTIETIASSIDAKDEYTGGHSERVGRYAGILAREMAADYDFSEEDILRIRYIGLLHDIGKIGVDDSVLNKAGKLSDEEFSLMKKHVNIGYELMGALGEEIPGMLEGIRNHHERFDGRGYPDGLSGTDIPLVARILCLADCYDAMTSNRVYRKRLSDEEVKAELLRCSGAQFDPALTEIFVRLIERGELSPDTVDGMEIKSDGIVPKSSLLENRLQRDLHLDNVQVKNPGHVRMMCYIAKLLEKRNHRVDIYFVSSVPKELLRGNDMNVEYTDEKNVLTLFDRTDEQLELFEKSVSEAGGTIIAIQ